MALVDNESFLLENCSVDLSNSTALFVLSLLVPSDKTAYWKGRTQAWYAFFYLLVIVYSILYLALAISCTILLSKSHLAQRFRVRTFIAIDLTLIVLGASRFLFLLLDPWGQSGFCSHFACVIFSRLLGALAFPSLTASYTLVFITLWISARIQLGRSWVQRLKILIPLCCIHYIAAVTIEVLLLTPIMNTLVVLILLVICEAVFSAWGFTVCFLFVFAGYRLLKTLEKTARSSSVICKDTNMNRHDLIENSRYERKNLPKLRKQSLTTMKLKNMLKSQQKRALRKITLITYVTVLMGMLYSVLSSINLILLILTLFDSCPGRIQEGRMLPGVWLVFRYIFFTIEICMSVLLTYAINDYLPLINAFKKVIIVRCCKSETMCISPEVGDIETPRSDVSSSELINKLKQNDKQESSSPEKEISLSTRNEMFSVSSNRSEQFPSILEASGDTPPADHGSLPKIVSPLMVSFHLND